MASHMLIISTIWIMGVVLLGLANGADPQTDDGRRYSTPKVTTTAGDVSTGQLDAPRINFLSEKDGEKENTADAYRKSHFSINYGPLKQLNIVKRAPNGFTGMRGKKDDDGSPFTWNEYDPILDGSSPNDSPRYKKAPSGFYGVRGKKYNDYSRLDDYVQKLEEDRVRELMLKDFINRLASTTSNQNEISKRAPTGFTGVRGKRPYYGYSDEEDMGKRAPANAFMGVRGKKDVDHQTFKRSPNQPLQYFGNRGKQNRFVDFTNKFVAVRGKKDDSNDASNDIDSSAADSEDERPAMMSLSPAQERYFVNMLPSLWYGASPKRTPSGFLGMRGKRGGVRSGMGGLGMATLYGDGEVAGEYAARN